MKKKSSYDYYRTKIAERCTPYKGKTYTPAAKKHPCFGCAHFDPDATLMGCVYLIHQVDYHLPQRPRPRPPYYECLYRSWRPDRAGDFDDETKAKIKTAKKPVVDLETLQVYADKSELHGDTRWRYLTPEEIEIFKR